ncbi:CidA/LrgA family protein [Metasolibacillus sp.]|uniref:CidA/LrgA family protein n=1 Tax=Metasolibacillus sp. TaxID=2703680 RepID=UPI0025E5533D|nr:CidA/LrgA family protein [Metasolibacillus sp.]MCT6926330.1 CidA/LrgA family protein [Metasolibacillus sp.]MCT6942591.1 CidA/LrgA family protein [Metasolibacillus sp.]
MQIIRTIVQIGILTIYYYLGVVIVNWTGIFIPASIVGLILLWLSLYFKLIKVQYIQDGATFFLAFLTLFFIPSTVGVVDHPELLSKAGLYLILAVILSTLVAIALTGKWSQWIEKKEAAKDGEQ